MRSLDQIFLSFQAPPATIRRTSFNSTFMLPNRTMPRMVPCLCRSIQLLVSSRLPLDPNMKLLGNGTVKDDIQVRAHSTSHVYQAVYTLAMVSCIPGHSTPQPTSIAISGKGCGSAGRFNLMHLPTCEIHKPGAFTACPASLLQGNIDLMVKRIADLNVSLPSHIRCHLYCPPAHALSHTHPADRTVSRHALV